MSENNPPIDWVEFTLRFICAFIAFGILVAGILFLIWNMFLPNLIFFYPISIWLLTTTSISIWTARTDRWTWLKVFFEWLIWW